MVIDAKLENNMALTDINASITACFSLLGQISKVQVYIMDMYMWCIMYMLYWFDYVLIINNGTVYSCQAFPIFFFIQTQTKLHGPIYHAKFSQ